MAFIDMQTELRGSVPKLSFSYCKTLINRAYRTIRERNLWSFQLFEGQWISPPALIGAGTATVTQGSNLVQLDSVAASAIAGLATSQPYSLVTQRQFRIASGGVYNIWGVGGGSGGYGSGGYGQGGYGGGGGTNTLTLDRWYGEGSLTSAQYMIYQCYYVPTVLNSPITDFKSWLSIRDMANFCDLYTDRYNKNMLDKIDPQRTQYAIPTDVVPYQNDQNPASPSYGSLMFELWGQPTFNINYQLYGIRGGMPLAKPTDTLPFALGEDVVLALARVYAYEWAEANKDITPRGGGPDFKFLMGSAMKQYETLLRLYRMQDRERVDNWFSIRDRLQGARWGGFYNTLAGTASPGWGGF